MRADLPDGGAPQGTWCDSARGARRWHRVGHAFLALRGVWCASPRWRCVSAQLTIRGDEDVTFPYVPSVLYYMCFELVKNALRATVEHQHFRHHRECPGRSRRAMDAQDPEGGELTGAPHGGCGAHTLVCNLLVAGRRGRLDCGRRRGACAFGDPGGLRRARRLGRPRNNKPSNAGRGGAESAHAGGGGACRA